MDKCTRTICVRPVRRVFRSLVGSLVSFHGHHPGLPPLEKKATCFHRIAPPPWEEKIAFLSAAFFCSVSHPSDTQTRIVVDLTFQRTSERAGLYLGFRHVFFMFSSVSGRQKAKRLSPFTLVLFFTETIYQIRAKKREKSKFSGIHSYSFSRPGAARGRPASSTAFPCSHWLPAKTPMAASNGSTGKLLRSCAAILFVRTFWWCAFPSAPSPPLNFSPVFYRPTIKIEKNGKHISPPSPLLRLSFGLLSSFAVYPFYFVLFCSYCFFPFPLSFCWSAYVALPVNNTIRLLYTHIIVMKVVFTEFGLIFSS